MKKLFVILLCLFFLSACSTAVPSYHRLSTTDKPEVAVCIFDTYGAEGGYEGKTDFGTMIAEFTAGLLQQLHYKVALVSDDSDTSNFTYIIKGKFSQIEPGNWGTRFWIGCGAGAARMTVLLKFIRVSDQVELGSAKFSTTCTMFYGQESSLRRISAILAHKIAKKFTAVIMYKN